jgi:hypothetical protein
MLTIPANVNKEFGRVEISLDDGSHLNSDQIETFRNLYPFVNKTFYILLRMFTVRIGKNMVVELLIPILITAKH